MRVALVDRTDRNSNADQFINDFNNLNDFLSLILLFQIAIDFYKFLFDRLLSLIYMIFDK